MYEMSYARTYCIYIGILQKSYTWRIRLSDLETSDVFQILYVTDIQQYRLYTMEDIQEFKEKLISHSELFQLFVTQFLRSQPTLKYVKKDVMINGDINLYKFV